MIIKSYSEMSTFNNYKDRFNYLKLSGVIGEQTFGCHRFLNQRFYKSKEWAEVKKRIILRDNGCDLGIEDVPIGSNIYIHHINPITIDDIRNRNYCIIDPNNLICVSFDTHNALHYGKEDTERIEFKYYPVIRTEGDTCLWR